jgi:hypothetical protein
MMINSIAKKIKGKAQQVNGDYQIRSGNTIGGGLKKLEGKITEGVANLQIRRKRNTK